MEFEFEHLDELGDLCRKKLMVEIMGKHSNIIFCREDGTILDSIKHVSAQLSSVREVLPGRPYFIPMTVEKAKPPGGDGRRPLAPPSSPPLPPSTRPCTRSSPA